MPSQSRRISKRCLTIPPIRQSSAPLNTAAAAASLPATQSEAVIDTNESRSQASRPLDAVAHIDTTARHSRSRRRRDDVRRGRPAEPDTRLGGITTRRKEMYYERRNQSKSLRHTGHGGLRALHGHATWLYGALRLLS